MGLHEVLELQGAKIAIFRALQLGDMLCSIPAVKALRKRYPQAEIVLVGMPWAESFIHRFSMYFDRFIHFSGWPGLPEQEVNPALVTQFLQEIQLEHFDLILQMQGNGNIVNPMIELWGGKTIGGFTLPQYYSQKNNNLFIDYPTHLHEVERHLRLIENMGIEASGIHLEFPLMDKDWEDFEKLGFNIPAGEYVCIHPGSRGSWRQWPPVFFASLGDYCAGQGKIVLITGTEDELPIVNEVASLMKNKAVIMAGKTSLGAAAILIKFSFVLIANCSGPSHIAAALQTPSVIISMDGEPERWAPLNKQLHRTIDWTKTPEFELVFNALESIFSNYPKTMHWYTN